MSDLDIDDTEPDAPAERSAPHGGRGLVRRLYRGETTYPFVEKRKVWYSISGVLIAICLISIIFRQFNLSIDFEGGSQFQVTASGTSLTTSEVSKAFTDAGADVGSPAQEVGSGSLRSYIIKTPNLTTAEQNTITNNVAAELKISSEKINVTSVSSSWGDEVSKKALQGLIVFLIAVSIYISFRFQYRMAIAAIVALIHDLILTAGVYSIIGFEVTPSTVVGLLTILGFSLYDTVVIFDKVAENTKDLTAGSRMTFTEATDMAVNQTLMRSFNTSLISLLPVSGLLFIGAGVLGVGTIKDLALVMFVGLATGAYSSLFLAAPIVADLTERLPDYKALTSRVKAKRASAALKGEKVSVGGARPVGTGGPAPAPRPGARPQRKAEVAAPAAPAKPAARPAARKPGANRPKQPPRKKR